MRNIVMRVSEDQFDELVVDRLKEAYVIIASSKSNHPEDIEEEKKTLEGIDQVIKHFSTFNDYEAWTKFVINNNSNNWIDSWKVLGKDNCWEIVKD